MVNPWSRVGRLPMSGRGVRIFGGSQGFTPRRVVILCLALVLALGVGTLGTVGWIGSERAIHRQPKTYAWQLSDYPDLRPERVTVASRTQTALAGTFFPGRNRATIILSHGYGDDQNQMLPWASFLHQAGFSVFTYDMRGRGASGGGEITLGALEADDLSSVVDYLVTRPDVDPDRIGALGVSLGGAVTILAAARDPRIKAVVDDCGFSDASRVIDTSFERYIGLPAFPFSPVTVAIAERRVGQSIAGVRPVDVIGQISPRPILIIHGQADTPVPVAHSERNFLAAGEPEELWLVPGAEHNGSREVAGPEYERRVTAFFQQSLGG